MPFLCSVVRRQAGRKRLKVAAWWESSEVSQQPARLKRQCSERNRDARYGASICHQHQADFCRVGQEECCQDGEAKAGRCPSR